jgi:putative oxidoreductase
VSARSSRRAAVALRLEGEGPASPARGTHCIMRNGRAHGTNKVFGSGGLEGTTGWFDALGLQPAHVHARMAAATEIGAGALITLGAGNPLPSAAVVGLMATAAATDHRGKGFFVFKGGWEYTAVVAAAATALAGLGNGRWSVDQLLRRKARSGTGAAAAALLAATYRPNKKESEPEVEIEIDTPPVGGEEGDDSAVTGRP